MKIGIVTTWFERGAAYVSKQYKDLLDQNNEVFIFARGGESYAKGDINWDNENVFWSKNLYSPFSVFTIDEGEFKKWIKSNQIKIVLFNEQRWYIPLLWCKQLNIKTICYVDYYKENELELFNAYDGLICNTKRHYSVFKSHKNSIYLPWGTDLRVFNKNHSSTKDELTFFHSCGMAPYRKGTDLIIEAFSSIDLPFKLIIHTQKTLSEVYPNLNKKIQNLKSSGKLEIISKTVKWPGLYHLGDVYLYPSRLDGIGLSLIEAIASGLAIITTNNAPMSDFVSNNGELVDVDKFTSRFDGYYWPYAHVKIEDFIFKITKLINDRELVERYKMKSLALAKKHYNWSENSDDLQCFFEKVMNGKRNYKDDSYIQNIILKYENEGFKSLNKYIIKYQFIFKQVRKFLYKLKNI